MSKQYKLTINCETPELREAITEILMLSKDNLAQHITMVLSQRGVASDTKITIEDKEMFITQKTGDRGIVIISSGIGYETAGYDTLPEYSKYIVAEKGAVLMYVKMPDNVDVVIGQYEDIPKAAAAVNSNDVIDAVKNLERQYTEKNNPQLTTTEMNGEADIIEVGDSTETV